MLITLFVRLAQPQDAQLSYGTPSPCNCLGGYDIGNQNEKCQSFNLCPVCLLDQYSSHLSLGGNHPPGVADPGFGGCIVLSGLDCITLTGCLPQPQNVQLYTNHHIIEFKNLLMAFSIRI